MTIVGHEFDEVALRWLRNHVQAAAQRILLGAKPVVRWHLAFGLRNLGFTHRLQRSEVGCTCMRNKQKTCLKTLIIRRIFSSTRRLIQSSYLPYTGDVLLTNDECSTDSAFYTRAALRDVCEFADRRLAVDTQTVAYTSNVKQTIELLGKLFTDGMHQSGLDAVIFVTGLLCRQSVNNCRLLRHCHATAVRARLTSCSTGLYVCTFTVWTEVRI